MTRLLTPHIATMTELREPHKVLARAKGEPTAILRTRPSRMGRSVAPRLRLLRRPLRGPQRPEVLTTEDIGQIIIRSAQRLMEDGDLADWLRDKAKLG